MRHKCGKMLPLLQLNRLNIDIIAPGPIIADWRGLVMSVVLCVHSWPARFYHHATFDKARHSALNTTTYAQKLQALRWPFLPAKDGACANLSRHENHPALANAGCDNTLFTTFGQTDKDTTACTAAVGGILELGHRPPPQGITGAQISPKLSLGGGVVA
ncbi:MAG: hypothetical protein WBC90_03855 [Albidovulum sp.]